MEKLIVHTTRMRSISPEADNVAVQVGRPEVGDYVTSFMLENLGKNSLIKIRQDGMYLELRPGDAPITVGVEWPSVIRTNLKVTFEAENQQQYNASGARPPLNPAENDMSQPDAIFHSATMFEVVVDLNTNVLCPT